MPKPIETLTGQDAIEFQQAIGPHVVEAVGLQGAQSARLLGFVEGLGGANADANKLAWEALLQQGGSVYFPEGQWDFRFASTQKVACPSVTVLGAGEQCKFYVGGSSIYLDIAWANVEVRGIHWYAPDQITAATPIIGIDDMVADTGYLRVTGCWFTNVWTAIQSATKNVAGGQLPNPWMIASVTFCGNVVRCANGLSRVQGHRGRIVQILDNDIDCGAQGGIEGGYGGIVWGYIRNNGADLYPEEVATTVIVRGNVVRNIKPLSNPGSSGNYGIQIQALAARIIDNTVEKVYPFYGSVWCTASLTVGSAVLTDVTNIDRVQLGARVTRGTTNASGGIPGSAVVIAIDTGAGTVTLSEAVTANGGDNQNVTFTQIVESEPLFTGDGATTTFAGTLAHVPTPDSVTISTGGAVVADDADHGWDRGEFADAENSHGRQRVLALDGTYLGYIDYRTRAWSLTFPVAPADGAVYTASYFEGAPIDNVEPIYTKSSFSLYLANVINDCQNAQGALGIKGGGSNGYLNNETWRGGPNSAYGVTVLANVVRNRIQGGIFSRSRAIWLQQDVANLAFNTFEGMSDRILRLNFSAEATQIRFRNNTIRDFYGQVIVTTAQSTRNLEIDIDVDGWIYDGTEEMLVLDMSATGSAQHHGCSIEKVTITDRVTAGRVIRLIDLAVNDPNVVDIVAKNINIDAPWRGVYKTGTGNGGTIRFLHYRPAGLHPDNLVPGTVLSDDKLFEVNGVGLVSMTGIDDSGNTSRMIPYVIDNGGANTIIVNATNVDLVPGLALNVRMSSTNTLPVVLNLNGLGEHEVYGDGLPLTKNSLLADHIYQMMYDGTRWNVQGLPPISTFDIAAGVSNYINWRIGLIETRGTLDIAANSDATYDLPNPQAGWVNPSATFQAFNSAAYSVEAKALVVVDFVRDPVTDDITGITFHNPNGYPVKAFITTAGT